MSRVTPRSHHRRDHRAVEPRRTGVLTIRAWLEDDAERPLRALIRYTLDVSAGSESSVTLAEPGDIVSAVERWLHDMQWSDGQVSEEIPVAVLPRIHEK